MVYFKKIECGIDTIMTPPPEYNDRALVAALDRAGITNPTERAMFVAQMAHESGGFRYDEEIASGADYEGREDLGNTQTGDGVRFKGRGYIQLTGRANYEHFGEVIGQDLVNNPDLAKRPDIAADIAVAYWMERVDREAAQRGDVDTVTRNINGGTNGLEDRRNYFEKYNGNLPEAATAVAAAGSSSISLPSAESLNALIADLKAHNSPVEQDIINVQSAFANQDASKMPVIEAAFKKLYEEMTKIYNASGVEMNARSQMIGMHLGVYSSAVLLSVPDDTLISNASIQIDGQTVKIDKTSFDGFIKEMRDAGITIPETLTYETATAGQIKQFADQFYAKQTQVAVERTQQAENGQLNQQQTQEMDFFGSLMQGVFGQESGGILYFLATMIASLAVGQPGALSQQGQDILTGNPLSTPASSSPSPAIQQAPPVSPVNISPQQPVSNSQSEIDTVAASLREQNVTQSPMPSELDVTSVNPTLSTSARTHQPQQISRT